MKKILNEGLDFHDLAGQVEPKITVDEYAAKMGKDSDIVTVTFTVKSELAGKDLVDWFERGYDFVLDASVSQGEVVPGKFLLFVEMNRRTSVPERIIELLSDLKTLTDLKITDWTIVYEDEEHEADEAILKQVLILSPHDYREKKENEEELNEMREIAGLNTKRTYEEDTYIKNLKSMAGM